MKSLSPEVTHSTEMSNWTDTITFFIMFLYDVDERWMWLKEEGYPILEPSLRNYSGRLELILQLVMKC